MASETRTTTDHDEIRRWDDWFTAFEDSGLAFLYQAERASGEDSAFFKLVNR